MKWFELAGATASPRHRNHECSICIVRFAYESFQARKEKTKDSDSLLSGQKGDPRKGALNATSRARNDDEVMAQTEFFLPLNAYMALHTFKYGAGSYLCQLVRF
jgi:hypothetical protein